MAFFFFFFLLRGMMFAFSIDSAFLFKLYCLFFFFSFADLGVHVWSSWVMDQPMLCFERSTVQGCLYMFDLDVTFGFADEANC